MHQEANLRCIFGSGLVLMILFICSSVKGNPTTPLPWADPCGDSQLAMTTGSSDPWAGVPTPTPQPLSVTLTAIGNLAARVKDSTNHMMSIYVSKRFMDSNYPSYLEGFRLVGMPDVTASAENIAYYSARPVSESLLSAYHNLSLVAVHMEQVRMDEITQEDREYETEIKDIESRIYTLMCNIDVELRRQEVMLGSYVSRDVMSVEYRDIADMSQRRNRDYIILRDTQKLVYFHELMFTQMGSQ